MENHLVWKLCQVKTLTHSIIVSMPTGHIACKPGLLAQPEPCGLRNMRFHGQFLLGLEALLLRCIEAGE